MNNSLDISSILSRSFETWKTHLQTLVTAAVPVFAVSAILTFVLLSADPKGLLLLPLMMLVSVVVGAVFAGVVVRVVQAAETGGGNPSFGEVWPTVTPYLVTLILTGFLVGLAVAVGLIFLIIPGIIVGVHLALTGPVIVLEDKKYVEAMKRSWAIVKGNALNVFAIIFVMGLIAGVSASIVGMIGASVAGLAGQVVLRFLVDIFLAPLVSVAAVTIYFQLSRASTPAGTPPAAPASGIPAAGTPGTAPAAPASSVPPPPPPSNAS